MRCVPSWCPTRRAKPVRSLLLACAEEFGTSFAETVIGGFSQGAMLSTDVTLRAETSPRGLLVLSGTLLDAEHWRERSAGHSGLRYFLSHGRRDPLLDFERAVELKSIFEEAGMQGEWHDFDGAHEIPAPVLSELQTFLDERLA